MKPTIDDCKLIEFGELGDDRGGMVSVEGGRSIPFDIKRVFYNYGTSADAVRGKHANRLSDFVIVNAKGCAKVRVFDGHAARVYELASPALGLYIPKMIWKEMYDFSADCVMMVFADTHYDATEYIRDPEEYRQVMGRSDDELLHIV